jgi:MinD-like ATPase involved in chromosome partitioning or flagellar assembly
MTVIAVTGGKAAPGATTAALALGLSWPCPVLLVDADPCGGDMVPGMLPGRVDTERGLLSWLVVTRRLAVLEAARVLAEHVVALPEAPGVWLMPGVQHGGQAAPLASGGWERLARVLEREPTAGRRDVIVDTGRLSSGACWPVLAVADQVLLTVRPTARCVQGARAAADQLREHLGDLGLVALLVVGTGEYSAKDVSTQLGVRLAGVLPQDRAAAAVLTEGAATGMRSLQRSRLLRGAAGLAVRVEAGLGAGAGAGNALVASRWRKK